MSLLEMSFSGAILVLMIVVVRAVAIHRFPKKIFLALWIMAVVRLLVPFSVPVPVSSPMGAYSPAAENTVDPGTVHIAVSESHLPASGVVTGGYQSVTADNAPQAAQAVPSVSVWTALWIAGMTVLAGIFLLSYVKSKQEFRTALPLRNENIAKWLNEHRLKRKIEIRQFSGITAPMTYGLFRPVILLPQNTDLDNKQQLEYILFHEYVHIRHCDTALKFLATVALCVHWFNPLVWVLYILFNRDIELTCDECVIRRFGADNRSAYARTLISMEERKSFIAPFCNNFSKNAIEERIVSIMKTKKSSAAALFAAGVVVTVAAGAFITSVQANENNNASAGQSGGTSLSFVQTNEGSFSAAVGSEITATSITITKVGEDGVTYYSRDGGQTWTALTDEELEQYFSITGIEWWTYEEYAEWLENEKVQLQSMIGERGWTSGRGDFVWTQEIVDEAIAMYEGILEDIKNGMLYSKAIYGENDQVVMSFYPADIQEIHEGTATAADFSEYAPFGLEWDEDKQALFFNGERVRYFCDGAEIDGGMAIYLEYADAELKGEIDVHTVRERVDNGDGSYDLMGPLTGLEKYSQEEFDARTFNSSSGEFSGVFQSDALETVITMEKDATEELLKDYAPFGLSWEIDPVTGELSMSWQGKPVHSVFDGEKAVWIANNLYGHDLGDDAIDLEAVYEQGRLVGLQETQSLHGVETSFTISAGSASYGKLIWPVNGGYISEWSCWDGGYSGHTGIDISGVSSGDPVYAGADGVVTYAGRDDALGNYVEIYHPDLGISSCYAHNSALYVEAGQQVAQGERIAGAGSTGLAMGTHVHLEVKVNGVSVNPRDYLDYSGHYLAEVGYTLTAEQGESFAERFERYASFGITYKEGDGLGNVYYNGRLVSKFADLTPDGGAFTFSSAKGGGITVKTVYDENGKLTGIETVQV